MKHTTNLRVGTATVFALLAAACAASAPTAQPSNPAPETPNSAASAPAPVASPPANGVCSQMNRHDCLHSPGCVLEVADAKTFPGIYRCRPAVSACEKDLAQASFYDSPTASEACTRRAGCRYEKAGCYCQCRGYGQTTVEDGPETDQCLCACARGEPPRCVDVS